MEKVIIRQAVSADAPAIRHFIAENWYVKNHVFVHDDVLFDYYYRREGDELGFVLGVGVETGQLHGMLGYDYCNHLERPDVQTGMFSTIRSGDMLLGVRCRRLPTPVPLRRRD